MAYDTRMAAALSGATVAQLVYWRKQKLLVPEVSEQRPILYSFQDLLALRAFVYLRETRSLQAIRGALRTMERIGEVQHLSRYRLVAQGRKGIVLVDDDLAGAVELIEKPGHQTTVIKLGDVVQSFPVDEIEVPNLLNPRKRISVNPDVRRAHPVVKGTRVSYELVAGLVRDGVPPEEIRRYYPGVSAEAARDAVDFADYVDRSAARRAA